MTKELIKTFPKLGLNLGSAPSETTSKTALSKTTIEVSFAYFNCETNVKETTITNHCSIMAQTNAVLKNEKWKLYGKKLVETKTAQNASTFEL